MKKVSVLKDTQSITVDNSIEPSITPMIGSRLLVNEPNQPTKIAKIKTFKIKEKLEPMLDRAFCECGGELKATGLAMSTGWTTSYENECNTCHKTCHCSHSYPHSYELVLSRKEIEVSNPK